MGGSSRFPWAKALRIITPKLLLSLVLFLQLLRARNLAPAGIHLSFATGTGVASGYRHCVCNELYLPP